LRISPPFKREASEVAHVKVTMAQRNKSKVELTLEYNLLDLERETRDLSSSELERLHIIEKNLDKIRALEEIKVRQ
jgi:hypothetical protein